MTKSPKYTRSVGAESGVESYLIGAGLVLSLFPMIGTPATLAIIVGMLGLQMLIMDKFDRTCLYHGVLSQKLGPRTMRNASIGFAECVRPGGKPTNDHCLSCYNFSGWQTSLLTGVPVMFVLTFGPAIAFVRLFYKEHREGVPKSKLQLYFFLLRHPMAVQGEGPSNGDGLASMNSSESVIYPITPKDTVQGPTDQPYWLKDEPRPRLRDMFHDKLFCHRFFESHGVPHPTLVAEVKDHVRREVFLEPEKAPRHLVWKPRYSTMGLGVEKFTGWENVDDGKSWAPSAVPYVLEEFIQSTEYEAAEWYRMTTLWDFHEESPKPGYIWRARNKKSDTRVQTDIIGGANLVTDRHVPFVGPKDKATVTDTRTGQTWPIDPDVNTALAKGIDYQLKMHKNLGKELHSIGWDVMVIKDKPYFIEFNINNGFFIADHAMEEVEQMAAYYSKNFFARLPGQLLNFKPEAAQ